MKRGAFILAVFYFLSTMGYGVNVHYCLGRIADVSYAFVETSCACDDAGIVENDPCCDEVTIFNQIKDSHESPAQISVAPPIAQPVELPSLNVDEETIAVSTDFIPESNAPPRPIYIDICSLIFYA